MIFFGWPTYYKIEKISLLNSRLQKPTTIFIFLIFFFPNAYSQNAYLVNTNAVNVHTKASARSDVIEKANTGDTVFLNFANGAWLNVSLKNGRAGFVLNKFVTPVTKIIPVENISTAQQIDMSSWTFSFLFSATFKYFLLITAIVLLALLLIYYLK